MYPKAKDSSMKKYIGPLLLFVTALIWGFAFPFQKAAA